MKKLLVLLLTIIATSLIAGMYGALHNQVTYSISPEYFTKFKYSQFGFEPAWFGGHRGTVAAIGFLSSWWAGFIIGAVLGIAGLFHRDWASMLRWTSKAVSAIILTALLFGLAGYVYGTFDQAGIQTAIIDESVVDRKSFFVAGVMHNFSYLGGGFGLFAGTVYLFMRRKEPLKRPPGQTRQKRQ
ncbi:MAG TPA: hypothetical protein VEB86_01735 [Chryseosolibacter sp.]|nr:hypothetical protein [Chryseosolibacter sp.]